jgi:hypothetical protein
LAFCCPLAASDKELRLMASATPLAFKVNQLPFSRSKAYEEIAAGRLRAVKCGTATLILVRDLQAYLDHLPAATAETKKDTGAAVRARVRP